MFNNPDGWWAFLALIPFLIIYLRKPKPIDKIVPSLMFFIKEKGSNKFSSVLYKILRDLIVLLQLLALLGLIFSITEPFVTDLVNAESENTIFVIDVSASMQASDESQTLFERAISDASSLTSGTVTIVLAGNVPLVVLEKGSSGEADRILRTIKAQDTTAALGESMLVAGDIIGDEKGKVYVFSDFLYTEGVDPIVAKRALSSQGIITEFKQYNPETDNVGIVDLTISKVRSEVYVKNYGEEKPVVLNVKNGGTEQKISRTIEENSIEIFEFETPQGITEIIIENQDSLLADNKAYISIPVKRTKVLLVTNAEQSNLEVALNSAPDIDLTISNPPVVPSFDYEVIIFHEVDIEKMLPSFYNEVEDVVEDGAGFIITAQEGITQMDLEDILPIELYGIQEQTINPKAIIINRFTQDVEFGSSAQFIESEIKDGSVTLVQANDQSGSPIIAYDNVDQGKVLYYGIMDRYSSFPTANYYPVFWRNMINFLIDSEDVDSFNFHTGRLIPIGEQRVKTPGGEYTTNRILFDRTGIYEYDNLVVAANMLNAKESDLSTKDLFESETTEILQAQDIQTEEEKDLTTYLLMAVLAILFIEILVLKMGGDL